MAYIYNLADTWNASGTTFAAIKMNVTDTASAAGSLLMDLQVGGASRFSVGKGAGAIFATNLIEQRNGTSAQAFNLYNTYTDASNYERGFMRFVSNVLQIGAEAAGTGTGRSISISPGGTGTQIVSIATVGFQAFDLRYNATPFIQFQKYAGGGTTGWVTNASDIHYRWTSSGTAAAEGDVGIKRDAAGVLKITNGNGAASGAGKLIFIVPTTNPGITGALWNNAGTLAISA